MLRRLPELLQEEIQLVEAQLERLAQHPKFQGRVGWK